MTAAERQQSAATTIHDAGRRLDFYVRNGADDQALDALAEIDAAADRFRAAVLDVWSNDLGWDRAYARARKEGLL